MLKRIIKRIRIERLIGELTCAPAATIQTIIRLEWAKFQMRRRAVKAAVRAAQ